MKKWGKLAFIGTLGFLIGSPAQAVVYSLAGDWNDLSNPNSVWSYGPGLTHFGQPIDGNSLNGAASNGYWGTGNTFFAVPFMLKTTANGAATGAYNNNDFLAGDVLVHGPNDGSSISINWIAPDTGTIAVTSSVWYAHSIVQRSQDAAAFLNAVSLGSATVTNGATRANSLSLYNGNLSVSAGDILSFSFNKSSGQTFGSLTGIDVIVDFTPRALGAVPEPATWAMMILGFGAIGSSLRYRRRGTTVSFS